MNPDVIGPKSMEIQYIFSNTKRKWVVGKKFLPI